MAQNINAQDEILDRTRPPKPGPPKDVQFPDYFDTTLPNGINVLVIENNKIPAVSVRLVFKDAGSFYDGDKYGLASLTAEMLTKGTTKRSATEIAEEIDFVGGSINAGSDWDGSYISLSVLKKHLSTGIDILSDVAQNPVFADDELARVKEQRLSSILQSKDDAGHLSDKKFNKVVYGELPYSNPAEGTEATVKNMTSKDLRDFYKMNYYSGNLIIAFVGDITIEEALKLTEEKFSNLPHDGINRVNSFRFNESDGTTKVYVINKAGAVQSNLRVGHLGIPRNNPDYIAVTIMNTILGGYFGSRINYNLREKHGFTYGARSYFNPHLYSGDFSVDTDVRNEVTDTSITLILGELNRMISEEVTDEELETVKNYMTGVFPLQLETANAVASRVINLKLYNLPKDYYSKYISAINALTKQDILDAAKKYIHPENITIVVSGDAGAVKDKLAKFGEVLVFDPDGNQIK
ncbi:MAG TPA: pitrilysin family protein [Ignavibacteria bacterium]|nr:pitrilysin family protein [Ignavibacteria bacterium]HMQ98164.1 pitrilysin family protein [Ignavibacteria bacterium]